jgi:sulfofructose kinase
LTKPLDVLGIGLNATDTVLLVDDFPSYTGKVPFTEEFISPGGQVATATVACARLGLRAAYLGTIGDDERGRIQRTSLEGTGVDASGVIVRPGCPNQTAYIIVDRRSGERTVLWRRESCLALQAREIDVKTIRSARMLHLDGCDVEAAAFAARIARENGIPVSLDVDTVYPGFESVLRNVNYLIASEPWVFAWTGLSDPVTALERLSREYRCDVTAMTCGRDGAIAFAASEWHYSPGFRVNSVDTTGAGDVFHGAFCYTVLQQMPMDEALEFSNAAAALSCTALGARGCLPDLHAVEALRRSSANGTEARCVSQILCEQTSREKTARERLPELRLPASTS